MPCVCLSNTFARWKSLKTAVPAEIKPEPIHPDMTVAERGVFSDAKPLRINHPRKIFDAPNVTLGRPAVRMTRTDLINAESKLGSMLFGPIPEGHRREFFHDRQNIWIWHEDWYDGQRNARQMTVRYEVRTSGVYKKVATGSYLKLEGEELDNFRKATHAYLYVVKKHLYSNPQNLVKTA